MRDIGASSFEWTLECYCFFSSASFSAALRLRGFSSSARA
jgi:hypothetical protein